MAKGKVGKTVESLGDYLKEQRTASRLSLRQLAEQAGVSNPYLSQIERGLRKPSAEVLQQIAKALRISAEQLYIRAGIVSPTPGETTTVELAVLADLALTERQKQSLLDVYSSFLAMNTASSDAVPATASPAVATAGQATTQTIDDESIEFKECTVAKAQFDSKFIDLTVATKPLDAGVGIADLAVEAVRDYATEVQKKLSDVRCDFNNTTSAQKTAQKYLDENVATVTDAYGNLVVRGEGLVKRIRNQESTKATARSAKTTTAKAKTTKTQATKATKSTAKSTKRNVAKKSAPAKSSAKATGTAAKKTASSAAKATTDAAAKVGD
jgi:transcriptional regulator with XRE-family HTH domain